MKKTISLLLTVILMISILPMSSITASAVSTPSFKLIPSQAAAQVGDVISVDVIVQENSKICGLIMDIIYDQSAFEVVEVTSEYEFDGETVNTAYSSQAVRFVGTATTHIRDEATKIMTIKFKVLDTCKDIYLLFREVYVVGENENINMTLDSNLMTKPITIHQSGDENLILAPTCEDTGYKTYNCPCGEFVEEITPAMGHKYKNRVCTVCGAVAPDDVVTVTIQDPSRTTIRNKDGIILHATIEGDATGTNLVWTSSNNKFKTEASGNDLTIISKDNGYTTFTASVYNERGKLLATYSIEMRSKAGLFDKIGGFFRSIFGMDKIYEF